MVVDVVELLDTTGVPKDKTGKDFGASGDNILVTSVDLFSASVLLGC